MSSSDSITEKFRSKFSSGDTGVSPVIGVILMVAITVALVALVTVTVFDLGGDVSESPDATVQLEKYDGEVRAKILRNENVKELRLEHNSGSSEVIGSNSGESTELGAGNGEYSVIAVMSDGSEEVLTSKEFTGISNTLSTTISGSVKINPDIQGATVKAIDSNGNVVDTDTTDSNGEYQLEASSSFSGKVSVSVDGVDVTSETSLSNELYASAMKSYSGSDEISFNFDENEATTTNVGGNNIDVIYGSSSSSGAVPISNLEMLQGIRNNLSNNYVLTSDIDASDVQNWNKKSNFEEEISDYNGDSAGTEFELSYKPLDTVTVTHDGSEVSSTIVDADNGIIKIDESIDGDATADYSTQSPIPLGWEPIGDEISESGSGDGFSGTLNGRDYKIENLYINRKLQDDIGLFAKLDSDNADDLIVKNLSITSVDIAGSDPVGGLAGSQYFESAGKISNVTVQGNINANRRAGGILGSMRGDVIKSNVNVNIQGDMVGGIVGSAESGDSEISEVYVEGSLTGSEVAGVTRDSSANSANISDSIVVADVKGSYRVAGIGDTTNVKNSVFAGTLTDNSESGDADLATLVTGKSFGTSVVIKNSYYDADKSSAPVAPSSSSENVIGLSTSEMQGSNAESNMSNLDFTNTWSVINGDYPRPKLSE